MAHRDDVVLGLIQAIYEAVDNPKAWENVLRRVAAATGSSIGTIFVGRTVPIDVQMDIAIGMTSDEQRKLRELFPLGPYVKFMADVRTGFCVRQTDMFARYFSYDEYTNNPWYQQWAKPMNVHNGLGLTIWHEHPHAAGISLYRSEAEGDFSEDDVALLSTLLPHFQTSLRLHRRFAALELSRRALNALSARVGTALVTVDGAGRVLDSTEAAQAVLEAEDGLVLRGGRLAAAARKEDEVLLASIRQAAQRDGRGEGPEGGVLRISRPSGAVPYVLAFMPLPRFDLGPRIGEAPVGVLITPVERARAPSATAIQALFELTPAEARLAAALAAGQSLNRAAEEFGVSIDTVRTQLKAIFEKTGVRRQADLVRLLLRIPADTPEVIDVEPAR